MDTADAAEALSLAAAFDNRTVSRAAAEAWALAIPHVDLADAKTAIVEHYGATREWIMPADISQRVKAIRAARLAVGTAIEGVPDADPDNVVEYLAAVRARRLRIASGETTRPIAALIEQATPRRVPRAE